MHDLALKAIQEKLLGKRLTYKEIFAVMDEIAHHRLGNILTTYFAASGYSKGFSNEEIYFLTKAMIETGDHLDFKGIVADKHSIGGVPGTRTSMIVIPIVASAGFLIPKSSSRAITTPGGTADVMEILTPVIFSKQDIYRIVGKCNACIVWGGSVDIAPADDELITVEQPLLLESYDKILVSIMAKKIAFGSNHIIIEIPYGEYVKVHNRSDAEVIKRKFEYLAERFAVKIYVYLHKTEQPAGRGLGPLLEAREVLKVLEQKEDRPTDLEGHALFLAGTLLDLCLRDADQTLQEQIKKDYGSGFMWAKQILASGEALTKMQEIIEAQGGNPHVTSESLKPGQYAYTKEAEKSGVVKKINCKNATSITKILGAPAETKSGIYLHKKIGEKVLHGESLLTLYSTNHYHLKEAKESLKTFPIFDWE